LEAGKMDRNKDLSDFDIGQILQTNCQNKVKPNVHI